MPGWVERAWCHIPNIIDPTIGNNHALDDCEGVAAAAVVAAGSGSGGGTNVGPAHHHRKDAGSSSYDNKLQWDEESFTSPTTTLSR